MKISTLINKLNEYHDIYGDQNVTIHYKNSGEDLEIVGFETFKYEFDITVQDFKEEDDEDQN